MKIKMSAGGGSAFGGKKVILVSTIVMLTAFSCNTVTSQNAQITHPTPPPAGGPTPTPIQEAPPPTETPVPLNPTAPNPQPTPPPASGPTTYNLTIQNFAFSRPTITIKKGDTIVWTNKDSAAHTVTSDSSGPSSTDLATGQSYSYTFRTTGTFTYHCAIHPSMKGTVIVQ